MFGNTVRLIVGHMAFPIVGHSITPIDIQEVDKTTFELPSEFLFWFSIDVIQNNRTRLNNRVNCQIVLYITVNMYIKLKYLIPKNFNICDAEF